MVWLALRIGHSKRSLPEIWWGFSSSHLDCFVFRWCDRGCTQSTASIGSILPPRLMQAGSSSLDPVDQVTVSLAGLEITISVRRAPSPSNYSLVSSVRPSLAAVESRWEEPELGPFDRPFEGYPVSLDVEEQAISAETAEQLAALPLPFLAGARSKLRAVDREWTAAARAGRAFRAGVLAARRLEGAYLHQTSLGIPFKNSYYIALRGAGGRSGFWTTSYLEFLNQVRLHPHRSELAPEAVCHGFPTRSECEAFLAGARKPWPVVL